MSLAINAAVKNGKLLFTLTDPGPRVDRARGKETEEWLKCPAQPGCGSPPGVPARSAGQKG